MKQWLAALAALGLGLALCGRADALSARSAIVLDGLTGETLLEQNADETLPMASTTKIMTALTAIELGDIDRVYTVKPAYTAVEGSSMYLETGETLSIRDTLYGLMLMSGNDAALAIAGEYGGEEAFVAAMNEKAAALGLWHTHFDNPNGLDGPTHYTTARELAKLAAYAMENETFREIVSTRTYTSGTRTMVNHNKLLRLYEGAVGVKTGFTKKSGRCLVSAAERNGRRLIAVTLNAPDDWNDHMEMLDDGFAQYEEVTLHQADDEVGEVHVEGGMLRRIGVDGDHTVRLFLTAREQENLETRILGRRFVYAPVTEGGRYGTVEYRLGSAVLASDTLHYGVGTEQLAPAPSRLERLLGLWRGLFDKE